MFKLIQGIYAKNYKASLRLFDVSVKVRSNRSTMSVKTTENNNGRNDNYYYNNNNDNDNNDINRTNNQIYGGAYYVEQKKGLM